MFPQRADRIRFTGCVRQPGHPIWQVAFLTPSPFMFTRLFVVGHFHRSAFSVIFFMFFKIFLAVLFYTKDRIKFSPKRNRTSSSISLNLCLEGAITKLGKTK